MGGFTRKRKRRPSKRRSTKRRRVTKGRRAGSLFRRGGKLTGFPHMMNMNMNYSYEAILDPGAGDAGIASINHNISNAYDPTTSVGDHQPSGWDQIAVIYKFYRVNSFTIRVQAVSQGTSNIPTLIGLTNDDDSSMINQIDRLFEYGRTFTKILPGVATSGVNLPVTMKRKLINRRWQENQNAGNAESWAPMTGGPSSSANHYLHLWAGAFDSSSNPSKVDVRVQITYNISFKQVLQFLQS